MSSEKNYLNNNYKSFFEDSLSVTDPELYKAITDELKRQQQHIELIASENIVSQAVLEAQGSVLTNKYAEGYPGKRYYNGCEHVDVAENLAIEVLKPMIPLSFESVRLALRVPGSAYGSASRILRPYLEKEQWLENGSWAGIIELPAGMKDVIIGKIMRQSSETEVKEL